jgi:PIN domain-containing protein
MDVILDSNIFLHDLKFRGTQFGELFAYLRRTGCKLVLPTLVAQEVLERYRDQLRSNLSKAKNSWAGLTAVTMTDHSALPYIDLEKEIQVLSNKLNNPALGVDVVQYSDVDGIDPNEIARRGTKRLKPANSNGEELRDVILWLLVFQYARTTGREIALISGDHGFRESKDADALDPSLQAEIASEHLPIHFHREISSFVTSQSLSHDEVDEPWVARYIPDRNLRESILNALSASYVPSLGVPRSAEIDALKFVSGTQYRISKDSVYGELRYRADAKLTFSWFTMPFANLKYLDTIPAKYFETRFETLPSGNPAIASYPEFQLFPNPLSLTAFTPAASGIAYSPNVAAGVVYSPNVAAEIGYALPKDIEKKLQFDVSLSLRIESEKVLSWQVDEVKLFDGPK